MLVISKHNCQPMKMGVLFQELKTLRSKMMNLHFVENHIKFTMDAECKALTEDRNLKGKHNQQTDRS